MTGAAGKLVRVDTPTHASDPARSEWIRRVDRASVMAFALLWGAVGWQLVHHLPTARVLGLAAISLPAAVLAADFASGCVHWFADRYFDPRTPVLGPMLIAPFREHHRDPMGMTRHDFFEVSGNSGLVTLPLALALLVWGVDARDTLAWQLAYVAVLLFATLVFFTNQLHAWAHSAKPPAWVRRAQSLGLCLSPQRHALHHRDAYDHAYCVTTGWLNPALDRTRFFERIEAGLARLGLRVHATAGPPERDP